VKRHAKHRRLVISKRPFSAAQKKRMRDWGRRVKLSREADRALVGVARSIVALAETRDEIQKRERVSARPKYGYGPTRASRTLWKKYGRALDACARGLVAWAKATVASPAPRRFRLRGSR